MRHHCPVCGNKVEMQIVGGRILLFNKEGNYHSCAVDKKKKGVNMKRKALPVLLIFVLLVSFGCATLKASWDKATEDEKACQKGSRRCQKFASHITLLFFKNDKVFSIAK